MFDRELLLTLPRTTGRFNTTMEHLATRGIYPEPFYGFDFQVTGLETTWKYEVDHPRTGYKMGPGTINLCLSHVAIWKCMAYTNADSFLVLEDDVRFDEDWRGHMATALTYLPSDWDLLYVGSCCCDNRPMTQVHGRLHKIDFALCTHAYAFRRKAIPVLLESCKRFWAAVDESMVLLAVPNLKTYAILPRIAHQHDTNIAP